MGDGRKRVLEGHAGTVSPAPDGGEVTLQREGGVRGEGTGGEGRGGEGREGNMLVRWARLPMAVR